MEQNYRLLTSVICHAHACGCGTRRLRQNLGTTLGYDILPQTNYIQCTPLEASVTCLVYLCAEAAFQSTIFFPRHCFAEFDSTPRANINSFHFRTVFFLSTAQRINPNVYCKVDVVGIGISLLSWRHFATKTKCVCQSLSW